MDNKSNDGKAQEQVVIIEEKISKVNGETQIKRYARGKILGKGGFAKCYEVTNLETKKLLAAKIIPKASLTKNRARQKLISEIKIHKSLHHTNVVQFEHVFEDHENVYILLELCTNQTLNELLKRRKRLTELEVQCYLAQIISSLKYLHQNKVIHRDLKLGNLFLNEKMEIKLGDFGLATKLEFEGERKRTICGTPNYIAPEILDGKNGHSYEVDFWSLGVIIYALLIGKPPFETPDVKTTYKKIRMNSYSFPDHVPISDPARNLITRILNLDPARRPNLEEIVDHPFLNNGGTIPKLLPLSTLACPPSASYIKQFQPQGNTLRVSQQPQRLSETAPGNGSMSGSQQQQLVSQKSLGKSNLVNTEKVGIQKPLIESKNTWGTSTQSNWTSTNNLNNRPMTQKADIKPNTQSVKSMGTTNTNNMFATQSNLLMGSMNSLGNGGAGAGAGRSIKTNTLVGSNNNINGGIAGGGVQSNLGQAGQKQEVWVKQWVDYSSKYGLGYLLSNGSCGVFFNDSTKIIMDPSSTYFEYIERRPQDKQDLVNCYTMSEYPKELQKKVTLLQHFKSYLEGEKQGQGQGEEPDENWKNQPQVYVKKWMKTKHAIMFRLSNKIVQVNFTDKTEILLSSEQKLVTYVNKKGERSNYPLATALESTNTEMAKRLKYTKEILTHMLGQNNTNMGMQRQSTAGLGDRVDL